MLNDPQAGVIVIRKLNLKKKKNKNNNQAKKRGGIEQPVWDAPPI